MLELLYEIILISIEESPLIQNQFEDQDLRFRQFRLSHIAVEKSVELVQNKQELVNTAFLREKCSERINILTTYLVKYMYRKVAHCSVEVEQVPLSSTSQKEHKRVTRCTKFLST